MRYILSFLAIVLAAQTLIVNAQEPVDITAIEEQVSATDSERLLMALNTPIPDDALPTQFSGAMPMEGESLSLQRANFKDAFETLSGSVVYTVTYAPDVPPAASPVAGTPAAQSQQAMFSSATITYLVFPEAVDLSDQDAFAIDVQEAMGSEALEGTVEQITISDAPAVMISSVAIVNGVEFHAQWIAIPVGKVVVIGMVMTGAGAFAEDAFMADNEALALSGVAYLGTALDD